MNDANRIYLPSAGYVRLNTILSFIPVGRTTWWEGVKTGRFPKPIKLGPRILHGRLRIFIILLRN